MIKKKKKQILDFDYYVFTMFFLIIYQPSYNYVVLDDQKLLFDSEAK